jgi:hypothetical protein
LAVLDRRRHHALECRGVWRAVARLKLGFEESFVDVVAERSQRLQFSAFSNRPTPKS